MQATSLSPPSSWLTRWPQALAPGRSALDLACGSGRHVRFLLAAGLQVCAVDRDEAALQGLADSGAECIQADLEGAPWPLDGRQFDLVLVTNYLWRPLWPHILASVAPGGWLIYETFADGHQHIGRPSRADFLLQRGELLRVCSEHLPPLRVVAYEDGFAQGDGSAVNPRQVQRVAAVRETAEAGPNPRYCLP